MQGQRRPQEQRQRLLMSGVLHSHLSAMRPREDGAPFYLWLGKENRQRREFSLPAVLDQGGLGDEDVAGAAAVERAARQLGALGGGGVGGFEVVRPRAGGGGEPAVVGAAVALPARRALAVGGNG